MVRLVLEYASAVWVNCCKQDALTLEKLQLRIARAARYGCADLSNTENTGAAELASPGLVKEAPLFAAFLEAGKPSGSPTA